MDPEQNSKSEQLEALWKFKSQIEPNQNPDLSTLWANFTFTSELNFSKGQQNLAPHLLKD